MPSLISHQRRALLDLAAAIGLACAVTCAAFGQETPAAPATPTPAAKPDEVVVSRQRPAQLRAEVEKAENAVYDLFNSLNSTDEFDIHCQRVVPTGRRVPERVCLPDFMTAANSQAGKSQTRVAQGAAGAGNSQEFAGMANAKRLELEAEMKKLGAENAELGAALVRLVNAQQALKAVQKE